jgi:hypothetical protein
VEISGVAEALQNLTERGAIDPVVKATAAMSESGFASIRDAIAFGEIKESLAGKQRPSCSLKNDQLRLSLLRKIKGSFRRRFLGRRRIL